ncbi:MAG: excinuclease ABC subunit UvrC [Candidatus Omnitrophota bacterium]
MDIKEKIKKFPVTSGVYLMKDAQGQVLYVGKAISLRRRVRSYFRKAKTFSKTDLLVAQINDVDFLPTSSEAEALILEASLIKKYLPKYNIDLRDDKSYPYLEITPEKFPRIFMVRPSGRAEEFLARRGSGRKEAKYYGPYVNPKLIREALTIIRRIFPFRTCDPFPKKACLDYHLGLCDAPCIGNIPVKDYAKLIRNVVLILEGRKDKLYKNLQKEMESLARTRKFEQAAKVRDQIQAIGALYSGTQNVNYYKETEQLQRLLSLPKRPERIEAFDVSNMMGQQAVGSMVSFLNGKPDKQNYRRFRIRDVSGIDDFKMIAEIVRRRYQRLLKERAFLPDLIVIDGGKGQLSAAQEELEKMKADIAIISLAKRQEEIFSPRKRGPVILPKDSLGLKLLQRVRDEAHRFAVSYHRLLRMKDVFQKGRPRE